MVGFPPARPRLSVMHFEQLAKGFFWRRACCVTSRHAVHLGLIHSFPMAQAVEREGEERAGPVYKDHNLHVIFGVTLMAVLGTSSITPAFPEIRDALGISSGQVGFLITVFTLPGILLTPVAGVLSGRYGRRRVLVPSLFLFGVAGVAGALATDFGLLLVLRTLQGVGAEALERSTSR